MNYLKQRFFELTSFRKIYIQEDTVQTQTQLEHWSYKYFEKIYYILSWEDTSVTLGSLLILNVFFWFIVYFEVKLYGLLFALALVLFICDSLCTDQEQMLISITKYSDMFDYIQIVLYDTVLYLKSIRSANPLTFCIGMSLGFLVLRLIGKNLSGYEMLYLIILFIFFLPLGFKLLPEETANQYKNYVQTIFNVRGILAEEELIPFICDKDFANRDNDLDSFTTDKTADSLSTSLISGISTMPSYLEVGDIQPDVQEEDLLPNKTAVSNTSYDHSSESDSEHREMNFASSHFSGDSSSDEEMFLEKDTKFNVPADDSFITNRLPESLTNIVNLGNYFLPSIFKSTPRTEVVAKRQDSSSSSSSEFEFLSPDEVKDN